VVSKLLDCGSLEVAELGRHHLLRQCDIESHPFSPITFHPDPTIAPCDDLATESHRALTGRGQTLWFDTLAKMHSFELVHCFGGDSGARLRTPRGGYPWIKSGYSSLPAKKKPPRETRGPTLKG
jgi:hypothetical protein